ncbi:pyridoxamine 5'-phosphate oxidase [uncultured Algibacter sp.]|uniref:pyridoxamine 5'-phosphate oxidase n=1 Tax=uncultured Algibacter sp. TaxID=298659 RepID=UPI003217B779
MNDANPMQQFHKWFCEVRDAFPEIEVNAMNLATLGLDGFSKNRIVLLKKYNWEGFLFFTNYSSEKGKAIASNNKVCLLFPWLKAGRRITILGKATKIPKEVSQAYFDSRPDGSKIGAWASSQSKPITSRDILEEHYTHFEDKFRDKIIPKPKNWGGYIVKPTLIEFEEFGDDGIKTITKYHLQNNFEWNTVVFYEFCSKTT